MAVLNEVRPCVRDRWFSKKPVFTNLYHFAFSNNERENMLKNKKYGCFASLLVQMFIDSVNPLKTKLTYPNIFCNHLSSKSKTGTSQTLCSHIHLTK